MKTDDKYIQFAPLIGMIPFLMLISISICDTPNHQALDHTKRIDAMGKRIDRLYEMQIEDFYEKTNYIRSR